MAEWSAYLLTDHEIAFLIPRASTSEIFLGLFGHKKQLVSYMVKKQRIELRQLTPMNGLERERERERERQTDRQTDRETDRDQYE